MTPLAIRKAVESAARTLDRIARDANPKDEIRLSKRHVFSPREYAVYRLGFFFGRMSVIEKAAPRLMREAWVAKHAAFEFTINYQKGYHKAWDIGVRMGRLSENVFRRNRKENV